MGVKRSFKILQKTPDETRKIVLDWTGNDDLASGETLASVDTPTVSPSGLTASGEAVSDAQAQVTLSGGTANTDYAVTLSCTTTESQILEGEVLVHVRS
jgi:hypothetical protein